MKSKELIYKRLKENTNTKKDCGRDKEKNDFDPKLWIRKLRKSFSSPDLKYRLSKYKINKF